jgi:hypothetical protein
MADLPELAEIVAERLAGVARRAGSVAKGVALLTSAAMGMTYLVGLLVFRGGWLAGWAIVGLILFLPVIATWTAVRRLRRAGRGVDAIGAQVATLLRDRNARPAVLDAGDETTDDPDAPLVQLGKDWQPLRQAAMSRRSEVLELWESLSAVVSAPGFIALGIVASLGALVLSVVMVIVSLVI